MGHGRRRSVSSSSSSSSDADEEKKWAKAQKKRDKHTKHADAYHGGFPVAQTMTMPSVPVMPTLGGHVPTPGHPTSRGVSPVPTPGRVPEAGHRIPYAAEPSQGGYKREFDAGGYKTRIDMTTTGPPPTYDADGRTPVYIGSVILNNGRAVHPCKVVPAFDLPALYAYGGAEKAHEGRFDLLPIDLLMMEWVPASQGQLPPGRRPVQGGYEEGGEKLYHAIATVQGVRVPGKTGAHLHAANVSFGGQEYAVAQYDVLCWRY